MTDTLQANAKGEIKADKHVEAVNGCTILRNKINNISPTLDTPSTTQTATLKVV